MNNDNELKELQEQHKKIFSETLNRLMSLHHKTQDDIVTDLGINKSTISTWCRGVKMPRTNGLQLLADYFDVTISDFLVNNLQPPETTSDTVTFPVIGEIAAGYDSIALEDWRGETVEIPASYLKGRKKEEFIVLSVKGDSMYPLYMEGDKVLILKQSTLNYSGEIGAVLYEDDNATIKKVEYIMGEDWMKLIPINPEYKPKKIIGEELEHCRIIGIPKLLIREIEE